MALIKKHNDPLIIDGMVICPHQFEKCPYQSSALDGAIYICTCKFYVGNCNRNKKNIKLHMEKVLDFYDTPQLFVAKECEDGTLYLCLLYHINNDGTSLHIAIDISKERLDKLMSGELDLRDVFTNPERFWFDMTDNGEMIATIRTEPPTEDMLPDKGYYLNYESTMIKIVKKTELDPKTQEILDEINQDGECQAYKEAKALDLAYIIEDGWIVRVFSDGHKEKIKYVGNK